MNLLLFAAALLLIGSEGQVIDIGGIWEIACPLGCSCELQRFADLPIQRWIRADEEQEFPSEDDDFLLEEEQITGADFLKVATCVVTENPEELLMKLPSDIQIFTILESGAGDTEILLDSRIFQRFVDLISLDIQGIDYETTGIKRNETSRGGIVLSVDALFPLGITLLYLNLERVRLTHPANRDKANLVIKPMHEVEQEPRDEQILTTSKGHRLIFLSQQNSGENEDKEILPYDLYKQEMEGYRDNEGLLTGLGSLTHLRLYDCSLKDLSWHMFDGLSSLKYLSLERNGLKFIPEFCFYGTPDLRRLSLASNELLGLKSVDLAGLLMLESLDLRGNNLTFLSELSFPPFPSLKRADFRGNPLDNVFPSTFEIMNTTLYLCIGSPDAKLNLQKNSFLGLRHLQTLHLYNAEIPRLERFVLLGMPSLVTLKIRGNVTAIDFDAFIDLPKLEDIDLSSCHIRQISMDAFYGLEHARRIDLSNNELETIPPGLFSAQQQKELKEIILSRNRLTALPLDFFKMLKSKTRVQMIRLDGNPWECGCNMITWNPHMVSRFRETAPRCATPKRLRNWGVFHALRKGGLGCKTKRRGTRRPMEKILENDIAG